MARARVARFQNPLVNLFTFRGTVRKAINAPTCAYKEACKWDM